MPSILDRFPAQTVNNWFQLITLSAVVVLFAAQLGPINRVVDNQPAAVLFAAGFTYVAVLSVRLTTFKLAPREQWLPDLLWAMALGIAVAAGTAFGSVAVLAIIHVAHIPLPSWAWIPLIALSAFIGGHTMTDHVDQVFGQVNLE